MPLGVCRDVDRRLFGVPNPGLSRREVVAEYMKYVEAVMDAPPPEASADGDVELFGGPVPVAMLSHLKESPHTLLKPLMHLFKGMRRGALVRRIVAENLPTGKVCAVGSTAGYLVLDPLKKIL